MSNLFYLFFFQALKTKGEEITNQRIKIRHILSDLAHEIRNGFKRVFPEDSNTIDCNYHVQTNINKRLKIDVKDEKDRQKIKKDISILQLSQNEDVFKKGAQLLINKWKDKYSSFFIFFETQYVNKHSHWYEGLACLAPSTNVAQESTHAKIKMTFTNHRRVSMQEMKILSAEIIKNWSLDLKTEKPYEKKVTYSDQDIINAYLWAKQPVEIVKDPDDSAHVQTDTRSMTVFWVCAKEVEKASVQKINDIKMMNYDTFEAFSKINFQVKE